MKFKPLAVRVCAGLGCKALGLWGLGFWLSARGGGLQFDALGFGGLCRSFITPVWMPGSREFKVSRFWQSSVAWFNSELSVRVP